MSESHKGLKYQNRKRGGGLKNNLIALCLLPLLAFCDWALDFDESIASSPANADVQSYVGWGTDSLIGMWDGKRNVSSALEHDPAATTWSDLVNAGAPDILLKDDWSFTEDSLSTVKTSKFYTSSANFFVTHCTNGITIECVAQVDDLGIYTLRNVLLAIAGGQAFDVCMGESQIGFRQGTSYANYALCDITGHYASGKPFLYSLTFDNIITNAKSYLNAEYKAQSTCVKHIENGYFAINGTPWETFGITGKRLCMRIYNRVLTPEEISRNYRIDKIRFGVE